LKTCQKNQSQVFPEMKYNAIWVLVCMALTITGYFAGRSNVDVADACGIREARLVDSIILDAIFCKSGNSVFHKKFVVRLALFDFFAFGGKPPPESSRVNLLLDYINKNLSSDEIRDAFREEVGPANEICQNNCVIRNNENAIFMISGYSPLVTRNYDGESDCNAMIRDVEKRYIAYITGCAVK
jgi:hypothetical protein